MGLFKQPEWVARLSALYIQYKVYFEFANYHAASSLTVV